jgi:hypothetical protein
MESNNVNHLACKRCVATKTARKTSTDGKHPRNLTHALIPPLDGRYIDRLPEYLSKLAAIVGREMEPCRWSAVRTEKYKGRIVQSITLFGRSRNHAADFKNP